jgi:hypothetical protein
MRLLPWMACMLALQEQKPAITMDGMYAGFASLQGCNLVEQCRSNCRGAKASQKKSLFFEVLSTFFTVWFLREISA